MTNVSIRTRLYDKCKRALSNREWLAELSACPPSERHCIAEEVRLSESDLWSLGGTHPGPAELMPRRLEQLGLDPGFVKHGQSAAYRDLERVCARCRAWRRCERDLARGDVQAGMRDYCLNAPTIDALIVD
jgi:hypothetical protein